jgi:hypothetical protein
MIIHMPAAYEGSTIHITTIPTITIRIGALACHGATVAPTIQDVITTLGIAVQCSGILGTMIHGIIPIIAPIILTGDITITGMTGIIHIIATIIMVPTIIIIMKNTMIQATDVLAGLMYRILVPVEQQLQTAMARLQPEEKAHP